VIDWFEFKARGLGDDRGYRVVADGSWSWLRGAERGLPLQFTGRVRELIRGEG
jgi:hypothetical protein